VAAASDAKAEASGSASGGGAEPATVGLRSEAPSPPPAWMRPAAWAAGGTAVLLGGFAVWQGLTASSKYDDATAMLRPDGTFQPGADPAAYAQLVSEGDSAKKAALIGATAAALTAAAGGVLWLLSREPPPAPGLAFRF
jgi:hypothetical protein